MLKLNLISSPLKNDIKLRRIYSLIKKINYILIIMTIAVAIILLAARLILQNNFNNIVAQTTLVTRNNQGYNIKVRETNNKLNFISGIQSDFISWSYLIEDLAKITPADISFYLTKINLKDKTIKIKGRAGLRSSLLALKQNMANSSFFQEIDFPLKNILEKTNIDFEINAKLNTGNLIN